MKLSEVFHQGESYKITEEPLPEKFHHLIEFAILASKENSFDPMEKALMKMISTNLVDSEHLHQDWKLIQEYPLSKDLSAMSRAWTSKDKKEFLIGPFHYTSVHFTEQVPIELEAIFYVAIKV